jgi:hypothetical protein
MSLIHKALRKAEGSSKEELKMDLPAEEFVGKKPGLKEQLTPRTIVLLALAFLSLAFLIYKKIYLAKAPTFPGSTPSVAAVAGQPDANQQPLANLQQPSIGGETAIPTPTGTDLEEGKKLFEAGKLDEALGKFLAASLANPQTRSP